MPTSLISLLDRLSGHRVLVIGDVMLDCFVYGQVDRVSPEAPIPVLKVQRELVTLGGAGNVARNLAALGAHVDLIGVAGQDQAGYDLARHIGDVPHVTPMILNDPARPTTLKTRFVANNQQLLRTDSEVSAPLSSAMEDQLLMRMKQAIESADIVVLSDYVKGVLTPRVIAETISFAHDRGKKVMIDPKGRDYNRYRGADMLTPNRAELTEATHVEAIASVADAEQAARKLMQSYEIGGVLAKLGGDGVCLVQQDAPAYHVRTVAKEVFDVSGAGDTVIAALSLALAAGLKATEAAAIANLAGSIVVGKVGTAVVTLDEIAHELREGQTRGTDRKIVMLHEARDIVERWRCQGQKVGFTNGCFDLIHPGHLSLLRQARAACDRLVVGLNSDASIKRLKGESRPVQNEQARATVLASMSDVDLVVVFEDDTPVSLIKTLQPKVLVKGADYTPETVVGWDLVKGWGGELVLAKLADGHSTTQTIARINTPDRNAANG